MISWTQTSCGSDCTGPYNVIFAKGMTVRQFIDEMLTEHDSEWGYIGIYRPKSILFGKPCIEYSHGALKETMPDEYLDKVIINVNGSGGWSRSDFQLVLEGEINEKL